MIFGKKKTSAENSKSKKNLPQNEPLSADVRALMQETVTACRTNDKNEFLAQIPSINGKIAVHLSSIQPPHWIAMTAAIADAYIRFGETEIATLKYESICEYDALRFADQEGTYRHFLILSGLYVKDEAYKKAADALEKGLDLYTKAGLAGSAEIRQRREEIDRLRNR
jgi:hypothetical protein